jgi:hypothetical protein
VRPRATLDGELRAFDLGKKFVVILGVEGMATREHLVQNASKGPNI